MHDAEAVLDGDAGRLSDPAGVDEAGIAAPLSGPGDPVGCVRVGDDDTACRVKFDPGAMSNVGVARAGLGRDLGPPSNGNAEYNYLAIPNNAYFPEDVRSAADMYLMYNGLPANATSERKAFTYNGESYWLYRMGNGSITGSSDFGFNN